MFKKKKYFVFAIVLYGILHTALFCFVDLSDSATFLTGDRSSHRFHSITLLLRALDTPESIDSVVLGRGDPGDYLYHAIPYVLGGRLAVILFQIIIGLAAVVYLYKICLLVFSRDSIALIATALYIVLPTSIVTPHLLVSEALFNPVLIAFTYYIALYIYKGASKFSYIIIAAVLATLAISIRFVFVLFPFLISAVLVMRRRLGALRASFALVAIALLLPMLWTTFVYMQTDQLSYGKSDHSIGLNLARRAKRMGRIDDLTYHTIQNGEDSMSISEYIGYSYAHKIAFFTAIKSDLLNILLNTGVNSLFGRYLGWYEMPKKGSAYWRKIRDQEGLLVMVKRIWKENARAFLFNIVATPIWVLFLVLSLYGALALWRYNLVPASIKAILYSYPVYFTIMSFAAVSVRWGHRSPAEFVLCMFAVFGAYCLWKKLWPSRNYSPP